ncbi:MAG: hypothetical protein LBS01_04390 [Prevotellaceae bacterium]|jgi:hypothetical protein|nr:hypothetical protein [Prevotellaceae bacterium]
MTKKILIFIAVFTTAIVAMSACSKGFSAKKVTITTQNDSINYTLGFANGMQIGRMYMANDSGKGDAVINFVKTVDKAYNATKGKDEVYMQGYQLGQLLQKQQKDGIMENPNYKLNIDLMKQGLINAFRSSNIKEGDGMTAGAAQGYVQRIFQKIQQQKLQQQQQQQMPQLQPAPDDTVSREGHNH